jgi:NitT/TauT family transport system substrate-binding protein
VIGLRAVILLCSTLFLLATGCRDKKVKDSEAASTPASSDPASTSKKRAGAKAPLRIGYSDWPGWVAWQIAIEKKFFEEASLGVSFVYLEYVATIEAFSEGKVDAVSMTNGDALVAGSSGAASVGILLNDYSNGNDMIVGRPGIDTMADLRGRKVAVEVGFVDHLLLMEGLKTAGMTEVDVQIVNSKTHETPALLKAGGADAIAAWQPHSGQALEDLPGSKALFTSAHVPGLIYDLLFVNRESLRERRDDWRKVVKVWFRVVDFIGSPSHRAEAVRIMASRVGLSPDKYERLMHGTRLLDGEENRRRFVGTKGLDSVQGSSEVVDQFNVKNRVYKDSMPVQSYFDPALVEESLRQN